MKRKENVKRSLHIPLEDHTCVLHEDKRLAAILHRLQKINWGDTPAEMDEVLLTSLAAWSSLPAACFTEEVFILLTNWLDLEIWDRILRAVIEEAIDTVKSWRDVGQITSYTSWNLKGYAKQIVTEQNFTKSTKSEISPARISNFVGTSLYPINHLINHFVQLDMIWREIMYVCTLNIIEMLKLWPPKGYLIEARVSRSFWEKLKNRCIEFGFYTLFKSKTIRTF